MLSQQCTHTSCTRAQSLPFFVKFHSPAPWLGGRRFARVTFSSFDCRSLCSPTAAAAAPANLEIFWNWSHHHFSFESEPIFFSYKSHHRLYLKIVTGKVVSSPFQEKEVNIYLDERWTQALTSLFEPFALTRKHCLQYLLTNGHIPSNLPFRCQSRWG